MLFLGKNFDMRIVNNRRFYPINKNKVSIIIWPVFCIFKFAANKINKISVAFLRKTIAKALSVLCNRKYYENVEHSRKCFTFNS